ncbi:MAG: T9SS type A sorting domain-containing protein [Bacteroidetes bacterium]|nr:T9SS type A sorting domain-containing protein [Bacteroidota bacterium]
MRRLLFLSGLILMTKMAISQNSELLDSLKTWSVIQYNAYMSYFSEHSHKIRIEGDTLIDSIRYQKVWINETEDDNLHWRCKSFIRDENGKIFYKKKRDNDGFYDEYILYDFNAEVGDTFTTLTSMLTRTRVKIDSIFYSNIFGDSIKTWKVLLFTDYTGTQGAESYWYEGIGSEKGLLYTGEIILHSGKALLCYNYGDSLIYRRKGYKDCYVSVGTNEMNPTNTIDLYPNPASSSITLQVPYRSFIVKITSITGQDVYKNLMTENQKTIDISTFNKGVYIVTIIYGNGINSKLMTKI